MEAINHVPLLSEATLDEISEELGSRGFCFVGALTHVVDGRSTEVRWKHTGDFVTALGLARYLLVRLENDLGNWNEEDI